MRFKSKPFLLCNGPGASSQYHQLRSFTLVEFILVIAGFGGLAFNQATGVAITTIPAPFYTLAECQAAGQQAEYPGVWHALPPQQNDTEEVQYA